MKKKILAIALVVSMLAIAVVGGSLAWFTDTDEATNTFTIGSVEIRQNEDFAQDSQLLPVVDMDNPSADPSYVKKIVSVSNTGKNDAYVRTFVAVPKALNNKLILDAASGSNWVEQWAWPTVTVGNTEYIVHCFVNNEVLAPNTNSGDVLKGVYLDASVDIKANPDNNNQREFCWMENGELVFSGFAVNENTKVDVLVVTQAVQAQGFDDAQQALNAAFGEPKDVTAALFALS